METFKNWNEGRTPQQQAADMDKVFELKDQIADLVKRKFDIVLDDMVRGMSKAEATKKNQNEINNIARQIVQLRSQIKELR